MANKIVVLDIHKHNDNRISKHLSTLDGQYDWLRINFNFYPEAQSSLTDPKKIIVFDIAPSGKPYFKGITFLMKYFSSSLIDQIEERLRSSFLEPSDRVIFHVHDPYLLGVAIRLTKRFSLSSVIYDRHEYYESWKRGRLVSIPALFEKKYVKRVAEVIFVSSDYSRYPDVFSGKRITIVPNYPTHKKFQPLNIDEKISKLHELTITFAYFGVLNLDFDRDTALMLRTMTTLMRNYDKIDFIIAGVLGDERVLPMIEEMIEEFGSRVKYLGELDYDSMVNYLRVSHFGFMFIRPESDVWSAERPLSANKVYEYLISGTVPVVRAIIDDRKEIECCSLIFNEHDTQDDIVDRISSLLNNRSAIAQMISECQKLGAKFSWENVSAKYLECYERVFRAIGENTPISEH